MRTNPVRVLAAIQSVTQKHPELRVGQLLCIAMRNNGRQLDLFNISDDDLVQLLSQVFGAEGAFKAE